MKLKFLVCALTALTFAACGKSNDNKGGGPAISNDEAVVTAQFESDTDFSHPAFQAVGLWYGEAQYQNGIKLQGKFRIEDNRITSTVMCAMQGKAVIATTTAPARVDATTVAILASAEREEVTTFGDMRLSCKANIERMTFNYRVENGSLYVSMNGRTQLVGRKRR